MTTKHHLTHAEALFYGAGYFAPLWEINDRKGVPVNLLTKVDLGSPAAADADHLIAAATSTELPDTETVTYTPADDGTTPCDATGRASVATITDSTGASVSVWVLATPRALTLAVTHATSIVAMTCIVSGYDVYGQAMTELFTITATGTSKSAAGKKAFKYVSSIAFTAAADAEANTANLGTNDVLGLPYKLASVADCVRVFFNDVLDDSATVVKADATSPATNATGDPRGTVDTNSAADGSAVVVWMCVADPSTQTGLVGVTPA